MRPVWRDVNKFKRMVGEFRKELRTGIELYDNNKDDPERLATVSVELQRKKAHIDKMSTLHGEKLKKAEKEL
jgi:Sec-independent protein translocase protein TatA